MLSPKEHNALLAEYETLRTDFYVRSDKHQEKGASWTPQQYNAYRAGIDLILEKMEKITQKICGVFYTSPVRSPITIPF